MEVLSLIYPRQNMIHRKRLDYNWNRCDLFTNGYVENGEDTEEIDESTLDDNKNKIITSDTERDDEHDGDYNQSTNGTDVERVEVPPPKPVLPVIPTKPQSTEEKVTAILKEIQSAAPDSTSDGDRVRGPLKRRHTEDARIAELLNRRDTAVIYPEPPVEEDEEQHNDSLYTDEEELILKCMHCSETFLRAVILRDHMREKHADKPLKFMCPKCDETFHQKSQLDKHLTLHSPTSQNCSVCNKTFANVYRLQRHMISHNESTDLRKFKCPECGKAFKFKHHLKEHVRIHSGEKPFICNNCGKRFSHSGSFSSHTTSKKCWGLSAHKGRLGGQDGSQNLNQNSGQSSSQGMGMFGQKLPLAFTGNKIQFERSPLQSVPISLAHQQHFLPALYSQHKGGTSFFYPPQMFATPEGFLQPMFSVSQSVPTSLQQQSLNLTTSAKLQHQDQDVSKDSSSEASSQRVSTTSLCGRSPRSLSPHSQSTRSFSPQSHSGRSVSPMSLSCISSPPSHPRRSMTPFSERAVSFSPHSHSEQISPDVNSNTKLLIVEESETSSNTGPEEEKSSNSPTSDLNIKSERIETEESADSTEVKPEDSETTGETDEKKSPITCHYCGEEFDSPVIQHQHERYMCKLNKDIAQQRSHSEPCQSPHSTVSDISHSELSTHNGSIGNVTDDEEVDEMFKDSDVSFDEKKMRIRSLFTEEQQSYLKSQYIKNTRPKKHVLIQIGNKIGFPKRVIQVWFQNMRARERKQGREQLLGFPNVKIESGKDMEVPKTSTYIPNVPKPFPNLMSLSKESSPVQVNSDGQRVPTTGELPLDLSVRKSPPLAHGGMSRLSTPDRSSDDQALNLSVKKDSSEEREPSTKPQTSGCEAGHMQQQKGLQDSALFKYMQREGLIQSKNIPHLTSTVSPSLAHNLQNQIFHQSMASVLKMPAYSTSSEHKSNSSMLFESPTSTSHSRLDHESKLVIDESRHNITPSCNSRETSPHHSQAMLHVPLTDAGLHAATHNLTTLAEAAQHAANMSRKPKRLRKKTWRQVDCYMESEEVQLELEDSMSADEDHPSKKKRKSWKNHRVERDEGNEGMYGCDQCNKIFSKQSSLARHKYEHSGARPFACDMCTKSFKHKHHLTEHKRLHSGEKPFQCKKCGKRFSHSGSFSQHMNHRYNYCSPNKTSDGDCEMSSPESP